MNGSELAQREERAQHGIIEFAEEMRAIRDGSLYPGANSDPDAWKSYCDERWGMSSRTVQRAIQALPVLKRHAVTPGPSPSMAAAASVASLPESVQDAILAESPRRDDASDRANAVRKVLRTAERKGFELTEDDLIGVALAAKPAKTKKGKKKLKESKFTSLLALAYTHLQDAADYATYEVLSDVENDFAWDRTEKMKYELARLEERLTRPETAKDLDEEFSGVLGGQS